MHKCYAITGPFVPANEPMTLLSYKYLRCLNIECNVIALKMKTDASLQKKLQLDNRFQRFNIKYVGKYQDALFSIENVNLIKALYNVNKYLKKAINYYSNDYDIVFTSSFPAYVHRAGLEIKKKNQHVMWIASFSDPINNSPYKNDIKTYNEYSMIEKIAFKTYCKFYVNDNDEIIALENADILIFICEEERDFIITQYLNSKSKLSKEQLMEKSVIFPLNYIQDWNDIIKTTNIKVAEKYTFAHFGRIYGLRDATNFILAFSDLVKSNIISHDVVFKQYGEFRKSDIILIKSLKMENYFEIHDKIPYEKCIEEMNNADCLMIFDTILPDNEIQPYLPSKILEYSLLKKNTLTITSKGSPSYRIAKKCNANVCLNNVNDIKKAILAAIKGQKSILNYSYSNEEASIELKNKLIKLNKL